MNYCPYCGKPLRGFESSFCEGCTASTFTKDDSDRATAGNKGKSSKREHKSFRKQTKRREIATVHKNHDDGYDGYYDDVKTEDENEVRQGLDKDIIKRIAGIIAGVVIIIGCCIAIMYMV